LKIEGVIFDVDGTLVDSNDAHARAFAAAFSERGVEIAYERIRRRIGKGSDKLIPELLGRHDEAIASRKKAIFKQCYLPRLSAFPRVETLLRTLQAGKFRLAVASSAAQDELDALLALTNAADCFEVQTDAGQAERSKPDPDILQAALRKLSLPAARCLMVGDTPYDAAAAQRAGVAFIGLRCGGWSDDDLQPSLGIHDDPAHLLRDLERWIGVPLHAL
jgi:HAD superfamily hydrolase (TIGR01549 family)